MHFIGYKYLVADHILVQQRIGFLSTYSNSALYTNVPSTLSTLSSQQDFSTELNVCEHNLTR